MVPNLEGVSHSSIKEAEETVGVQFPIELVCCYLEGNGWGWKLLPLEDLVEETANFRNKIEELCKHRLNQEEELDGTFPQSFVSHNPELDWFRTNEWVVIGCDNRAEMEEYILHPESGKVYWTASSYDIYDRERKFSNIWDFLEED